MKTTIKRALIIELEDEEVSQLRDIAGHVMDSQPFTDGRQTLAVKLWHASNDVIEGRTGQ